MSNFFSKSFAAQSFGIPEPTLTEKNLSDQTGRVYIVTGGYAGVGQELVEILYGKNATVYVAGRSTEKAEITIEGIKSRHQESKGRLEFLHLDLNDLSTIKAAVDSFLAYEKRLDVLVNNAGVMFPPKGSKTQQGHDMQFGTNCLGPYLLTKLLNPLLIETAASAPAGSVRVLWASSLAIQLLAPDGGIVQDQSHTAPQILPDEQANYGQTKVGNVYLASWFQAELESHNIVSVSFNPGNLKTDLYRHSTGIMTRLFSLSLWPAKYGAYTELYAACSSEVGKNSLYVVPWGRAGHQCLRKDILSGIEHGGRDRFVQWCDTEVSQHA